MQCNLSTTTLSPLYLLQKSTDTHVTESKGKPKRVREKVEKKKRERSLNKKHDTVAGGIMVHYSIACVMSGEAVTKKIAE